MAKTLRQLSDAELQELILRAIARAQRQARKAGRDYRQDMIPDPLRREVERRDANRRARGVGSDGKRTPRMPGKIEIENHMYYLDRLPAAVPRGMILVHNDVVPTRRLNMRGFRAWLSPPKSNPRLQRCDCGWAAELGPHYVIPRPPESR